MWRQNLHADNKKTGYTWNQLQAKAQNRRLWKTLVGSRYPRRDDRHKEVVCKIKLHCSHRVAAQLLWSSHTATQTEQLCIYSRLTAQLLGRKSIVQGYLHSVSAVKEPMPNSSPYRQIKHTSTHLNGWSLNFDSYFLFFTKSAK